jgi:hypothetical protein
MYRDWRYDYENEEDWRTEEEIEEEMYRLESLAEEGYFEERNYFDSNYFHSKLVGVTQGNRQSIIRSMYENEVLNLVREPFNEYDSNAIAVYRKSERIGFLSRDISKELASQIDNGVRYRCTADKITGGNGYNYGVNILIERLKDSTYSEGQSFSLNRLIDDDGRINISYSNQLLNSIANTYMQQLNDWMSAKNQLETIIKEFSRVFNEHYNDIRERGYWVIFFEAYSLYCLNYAICILNLKEYEHAYECACACTTIDANMSDDFIQQCSALSAKASLYQGYLSFRTLASIVLENPCNFMQCVEQIKLNIQRNIIPS